MTNNEIKELSRSLGADLVGIASVERFVNAPKGHHPTDVCNDCNLCVELCPSGALADQNNFSQRGCRKVCHATVKGVLELRCWQCRNVCPYKHGIND